MDTTFFHVSLTCGVEQRSIMIPVLVIGEAMYNNRMQAKNERMFGTHWKHALGGWESFLASAMLHFTAGMKELARLMHDLQNDSVDALWIAGIKQLRVDLTRGGDLTASTIVRYERNHNLHFSSIKIGSDTIQISRFASCSEDDDQQLARHFFHNHERALMKLRQKGVNDVKNENRL